MVPKIRGITEVGRGNILTRPSGQTRDRGRNDRGPGIYLLRFEASARFPRRPKPLETFLVREALLVGDTVPGTAAHEKGCAVGSLSY